MKSLASALLKYRLFSLLLIGSLSAAAYGQDVFKVKYARAKAILPIHQQSNQYFFDLFNLALQKSGVPHQVETINIPTNLQQSRSVLLMEQGHYDVHWYTTNRVREQKLLPVRIPLFKGLIGFRLMFVHKDNADIFANIKTATRLKKYIAGQGRNWPDTLLLKHHEFRLEEATNTEALLQMLNLKRIEYFPRSLLEIWSEQAVLTKRQQLVVDQHIALKYPSAIYFFTARNNTKLHDLIEQGLTTAIKDGSFDILFNQFAGEKVAKSNLSSRTVINIDNPLMSEDTPLFIPEYWYSESKSGTSISPVNNK